jgi:hypothetical protein
VGLSAQGATFTFTSDKGNLSANVLSISVETPETVVVDMTPPTAAANAQLLVPTGEYRGGSIQVEYSRYSGQADPATLLGGVGTASFSSPGYSASKSVFLRKASEEARIGDLVRGRLEFGWTDYAP